MHFRALLTKYPPQTSGRTASSQWGCFLHNQVNARLHKPEFDCKTVTDHYKCGCAETDDEEGGEGKGDLLGPLPTKKVGGMKQVVEAKKKKEKVTEARKREDGGEELYGESRLEELRGVKLEIEGRTRGG